MTYTVPSGTLNSTIPYHTMPLITDEGEVQSEHTEPIVMDDVEHMVIEEVDCGSFACR